VALPFNTATVRLFLRSLKDLNELTLGACIVTAMFLFYLPIVAVQYSFDYLWELDRIDLFICTVLGFTSSSLQVSMAKSVQYEEPARLAVLNYFQPIIQLILDVIFF
jgi:drug/metabolite transporter (DMT)-like permease